ncbi:MAG: hypothetical protein OEW24_09080 [Chloroflexota bacterium]|nr:hypothetical protein [Chloroflexota bacterium]
MDSADLILIAVIVCATAYLIARLAIRSLADRRATSSPLHRDDLERRMERMEQALDAIALEVERNGELQRFIAKSGAESQVAEAARLLRVVTPV